MIIAFTGEAGSGKTTAAHMVNFIANDFSFKDYYWSTGDRYLNEESVVPTIKFLAKLHKVTNSLYPNNSIYDDIVAYSANYNFKFYEPRGFADKLKKAASIITGESLHKFYDVTIKDTVMPIFNGRYTYRSFLQKLATEACRDNLHNDIWVDALLQKYTGLENLVIYDLRFDNEARRIRELDGFIIKLEGRNSENKNDHVSERGIANGWVDVTIKNDMDKETLYNQLTQVLKELL